jgi:hypothetical protein
MSVMIERESITHSGDVARISPERRAILVPNIRCASSRVSPSTRRPAIAAGARAADSVSPIDSKHRAESQ